MTMTKEAAAERDMERCLCNGSEHAGRVTTPADDGQASTWVCGLAGHREAAERWVRAVTGQEPVFVPRKPR